jgi:Na+/proline symporter
VLPHGLVGIMVAAIFAATMSSADSTFNWMAAVVTKDVYVPLAHRLRGHVPSERVQLFVGKTSVAVMGVIAIWVALNMERFGGAFDVYLRANSLYSPSMFIPVMLGLVYTRTPWWSGMTAFGGGVLAVLGVSIIANLSQGMPVDSFGAIFTNIELTLLGIDMGRYELNTLTGILASTLCFFGSALFNKRSGAFAERITSLEHDLRTPAFAQGVKLDLRGLQSYRLAGRLSVLIGGMLLLMAIPTLGEGGGLNLIAGVLAIALGVVVVVWAGKYEKRHQEPVA